MKSYASLLIVAATLYLNAAADAVGEEVRSVRLGVGHYFFVPFEAGQLYRWTDGEFFGSTITHKDPEVAMASRSAFALRIAGGKQGTTEIVVETVDEKRFRFEVEVVASDDPRVASSTAKPLQIGLGHGQILKYEHHGRSAEFATVNDSIGHCPLGLTHFYLVGREEGVSDLSIIQDKEIVTYRVTVVRDAQRNENQPPHETLDIKVGETLELQAPKDFVLPNPRFEVDPTDPEEIQQRSSNPGCFAARPSLLKLSLDKQKPFATGLKPGSTDVILMSNTGEHKFYHVVVKPE